MRPADQSQCSQLRQDLQGQTFRRPWTPPADRLCHHNQTALASATLPRHGQSAQFDHVVGIDTHRDFQVAVALAPNGGRLGELTFTATSKGYEELEAWTEQLWRQAGVRHGGHWFLRGRALP